MADPPPVLTLLVKKGPREGKTLQGRAGGAALHVGRVVKGNNLAVRDGGASQRHLSVEFLPPPAARWAVTDLGSSNGTLLNGAPLVPTLPAPLSDGDLIKIGESTVLAVSILPDTGPGPGPAATRRSARNALAVAAAEEEEEEEEQGPAVTRRAGRRKAAAEAPVGGKEVEEEAEVPARRGGRKKAVDPPALETEEEEVEEEAAIPRRGRTRKAAATVDLPPNTRSTRAATRRGGVVECENDEVKVVRTGRGRGRVTRASTRKGTDAAREEEEQDEVAVARDREVTASKGDEEDAVETRDGTSNASEVVPAAGRGRARRTRGGRGRAMRASTRKAEDTIIGYDENEQEERDIADGRERKGSPLRVLAASDGCEEDTVAAEDDKLDRTSKASMVDVKEDVSLTVRAIEGRVNAQHAPADNSGMEEEAVKNLSRGGENEDDQEFREKVLLQSKLDGVGQVEENNEGEAIGASGAKGHVEERTRSCSLENMTLGEWFVRIEKYLLAKNEEAAEKAIVEVQEKHRLFCEHLKTLKKSSAPP